MFVLRATNKLLPKLRLLPEPEPGPSSTILGDWFATMLRVRSGAHVLAISSVTLLPVVVSGRDVPSLPVRLADAVAEVVAALGAPAAWVERERAEMSEVRIARTDDRSTVGVMTDLRRLLAFQLEDSPHLSPLQRSLELAETPIIARNTYPNAATRRLFLH